MKRFLSVLIALPLFGFWGSTSDADNHNSADPAFGKQPNIILVITDDQGYYDLSGHGNPHIATPNLDKLRDESFRFTRFQVSPTLSLIHI